LLVARAQGTRLARVAPVIGAARDVGLLSHPSLTGSHNDDRVAAIAASRVRKEKS
jgi:hypothetical protein